MNISNTLLTSYHGMFGGTPSKEETVIVLSGGGIDSFVSTWLYTKLLEPKKIVFLTFDYGQATASLEHAKTEKQADLFKTCGYETEVIGISDSLMHVIRNPLGDRKKEKKKGGDYSKNDDYVPNRNARFIFNAAGLAETIGATCIILGAVGNVNQDNSAAFLKAAVDTIAQSNRDVFPSIYAPFVMWSKSAVAQVAEEQKIVSYLREHTLSCFDATSIASDGMVPHCGVCRSCVSLKQAFKFAGVKDPYVYAE